jgi:transposase
VKACRSNGQRPGKSLQIRSSRKKNRILELYHKAPRKSAVLCHDEWGPLELKPLHGQHWARVGHPKRLRATYRRLAGTEQFLGFYDVHRDCLAGTIHKRKTVRDLQAAFRTLCRAYPRHIRLYVIMDNLPLHKTEVLSELFRKNRITPVWTPTYSSWLNLIECQFTPAKKFTLNVSDDPDHQTRRRRIYRYMRWRNRQVGSQHYKLAKVFNH